MRISVAGLLLALCGCDSAFGLRTVTLDDAAIDAAPSTPFGAPVPLNINTSLEEDDPSLTEDMLELYLFRSSDLWMSTRGTTEAPWGTPVLITELNTGALEMRPSVAGDGLTLYFTRALDGDRDIYVSTRPTRMAPWGTASRVAIDLNGPDSEEYCGWSSSDGLRLLVESAAADGNHEIYIATRPSVAEPFTSVPLDELNGLSDEGGPWATADGNTILFESNRTGSTGIWEAETYGEHWSLTFHDELESTAVDGTPWISADGKVIVFTSNRNPAGGPASDDDLYMATR